MLIQTSGNAWKSSRTFDNTQPSKELEPPLSSSFLSYSSQEEHTTQSSRNGQKTSEMLSLLQEQSKHVVRVLEDFPHTDFLALPEITIQPWCT